MLVTMPALLKQGNCTSHFAHAVHSRHPHPGWYHLQQMPWWQNDPFCCIMLLVIELSLLQRVHYNALSMGKESHKTAPWYFAIMPEKDRATDIGNMHRKIGEGCSCCSGDILVDRQTDVLITILCQRSCRQSINYIFMKLSDTFACMYNVLCLELGFIKSAATCCGVHSETSLLLWETTFKFTVVLLPWHSSVFMNSVTYIM